MNFYKHLKIRYKLRFLGFTCLSIACLISLSVLYVSPNLTPYTWSIHDVFQKIFLRAKAQQVVIIDIDRGSIQSLSEIHHYQYPFPRELYGAVAQVADYVGAQTLIYDMPFSHPSSYGEDDDITFAKQISSVGIPIIASAIYSQGISVYPLQKIQQSMTEVGFVDADKTKTFREMNPFFEQDSTKPSLAFATFQQLNPTKSVEPHYQEGKLLRFYEDRGILRVPFSIIVKGIYAISKGNPIPGALLDLEGKIWILGFSGSGLTDLKTTPVKPFVSDVYLQATSIANYLFDEFLNKVDKQSYFLLMVSLSMLVFVLALTPRMPLPAILIPCVFILVMSMGLMAFGWFYDYWLNPFILLSSGFLTLLLVVLWRYQREWRKHLGAIKSLESSLPPFILSMIQSDDLDLVKMDEKAQSTILYADLVNFSNLCDPLPAKDQIKLLNAFLDEVIDIIFAKNGYINRTTGVTLLATWGTPIKNVNSHALLGMLAGIEYQQALRKFKHKWISRYPEIKDLYTQVGVHTGLLVVGQVGRKSNLSYTAVGQDMRTAINLERLCKLYMVSLIVSEQTVQQANSTHMPGLMKMDVIWYHQKKMTIYAGVDKNQIAAIDAYQKALLLYQQEKWAEASALFEEASVLPCADIMMQRCLQAINHHVPYQYEMGAWHHRILKV